MKEFFFLGFRKLYLVVFILILCVMLQSNSFAQKEEKAGSNIISYVDCDLGTAQKYYLSVDGRPFYMTNIQVRVDKLRYRWGWDVGTLNTIIAQAAADGFNTVSIPVHWYEVERSKDNFDWTILDEYLGLVSKNNLKMELLWFSQNSGGQVQWLSSDHLRVPDYVLYSPNPRSTATTSEYTLRRDQSNYTLDLDDKNLAARESYVLGKVMAHIASWDKANGSKHTVIGVQLGNEVTGYNFNGETFTSAQVISYMNQLGSAVKKSAYQVWTRINCVWGMEIDRIEVNEVLRSLSGSHIDFVGIDLYKAGYSTIRKALPYKGLNYRMIMECEAEVANAAQVQLAALSGNNAYDHYDMCGPDGHGLYDRNKDKGFLPHGKYIEEVRLVNKLLNSDLEDIALNANGYGLFVHNWSGNSKLATKGVEGILFTTKDSTSQAISIRRSNTEIVLMNTKGGIFIFPDSLNINGATIGFFDKENKWVQQESVPYTKTSIAPSAGVTVRLTRPDTKELKGNRMQAEFASYGLGSFIESEFLGFAGNGYVNLNAKGGVIHWTNVDGQNGGNRTVCFRYANGGNNTHSAHVIINGVPQSIVFPPTGSWESYKYMKLNSVLKNGKTNSIRIEATENGACNIDELQIF